jgi:RimJ/RimL family protein N-acetyltransferase
MGQASIERFVTARLVAEPVSLEHFPEINRLHTDPLVMKTLSADGKPLSEEATRDHVWQAVEHWQRHGFGLWVFRAKPDGQFIGRGGLKKYQIDQGEVIGLAYAVLSGAQWRTH